MGVALDAAGAGLAVFPLRPRSKKPAIVEWEASATTDPDQIRDWWRRSPRNVGIACGPSRLLVVDLDTPHMPNTAGLGSGRDVLAALADAAGEAFPDHTYTVTTPTGGQHLYFTAPADRELRCTVGRLWQWIDTRGAGGYVVGAGSVRQQGRYRVHREAALDLRFGSNDLLG